MTADTPEPGGAGVTRSNGRGGRRAGAGRPRGPIAATRERQRIVNMYLDAAAVPENALLDHVRPVDILEAVARRLLADGRLKEAANFAARAAPFRHHRLTRPV